MTEKFVRPGQAARLLGVSNNSVRRWMDLGLLPGRRYPASLHRRIAWSDLAAFAEQVMGIKLELPADNQETT